MKNSTKIKIWAFFMRLGSKFGCHQREERSFWIGRWQFPICSRCTGILTGQVLGIGIYFVKFKIPFWVDFLLLFLMFLDWYLQHKKIKESTNTRRFITGNMAGIAQMSIIIKILFSLIGK